MRKITSLMITAIALTACTTYPQAMSYRPKNSGSAPYIITSEINALSNEVTTKIDGNVVSKGKLSYMDGSGQFIGNYDGHKVLTSCRFTISGTACEVLIDGENAGNFHA